MMRLELTARPYARYWEKKDLKKKICGDHCLERQIGASMAVDSTGGMCGLRAKPLLE